MLRKSFQKLFGQIQVVRSPRHRLATFGTTRLTYKLVTEVPGFSDRSRIRIGELTAEKPAIITPDVFREKFIGFGDAAQRYVEGLVAQYGEALRGLEYQFRHEPEAVRVELQPVDVLLPQLAREFDRDGGHKTALIRGADKHWELALMKFIAEETLASFTTNMRDLEQRGFFDGGDPAERRRHNEIRMLIERAHADRQLVPELGKRLKQYGLFEQYQDAFFSLVQQ